MPKVVDYLIFIDVDYLQVFTVVVNDHEFSDDGVSYLRIGGSRNHHYLSCIIKDLAGSHRTESHAVLNSRAAEQGIGEHERMELPLAGFNAGPFVH